MTSGIMQGDEMMAKIHSVPGIFGGENIRLNDNPFGTDHSDGFCDMNADDP